jgi:hypothetical protein
MSGYFGPSLPLNMTDVCADIGSSETQCTDRLTVAEEDRELLSLCGEKDESIVIESDGGGLDVSVSIRSKNIFPKRGVLFQYKGQLMFSEIMTWIISALS